MSFWKRLFGREQKVANASALTYGALFGIHMTSKTGLPVTEETALRVSTVLACARVVAEDCAKIPARLVREDRDGSKTVLYEHPVHQILSRQANSWQTAFEWKEMTLTHALLCGTSFSVINRAADGSVLELIPLPPHRVQVRQLPDWTVEYDVTDPAGGTITLRQDQMHVLRGLTWSGPLGLNLIQGNEAIGLSMAAEQSQAYLHANSSRPAGLLSTTAVLKDEQVARLKRTFAEHYAGVANTQKTLVLDSGLSWTPLTMSGVDAQHLETRRFQVEEICRIFRVQPIMIGHNDKASTFASAESFFSQHVGTCLQPWITRLEQTIQRDLLSPDEVRRGVEAKFNMNALLRGDSAARSSFYESATTRAGWMTRNEVRRLEDLDPLPGLDEILPPAGSTSPAPAAGTKPAPSDPANPDDSGNGGQ